MPTADDENPWGREGPPDDAYTRVTRDLATLYAPLAGAAQDTVQRLTTEYDVVAHDRLNSGRARFTRVTKAVVLVPRDDRAPTLTIAWTNLPGLTVCLGEGVTAAVPPCGCDACAESLERCLDLLADEVELAEREWTGIRRSIG